MPGFVFGVTELFEVALVAFGFACDADLAAVVDDLVGEVDPAVLGNYLHQFLFYFLGRVAFGKGKAMGDAEDVRIDNHAFGFFVADAENDVGRFAGCAGDGDEFGEGLGDLPIEISDDFAGCALNGFGLVVIETRRSNDSFELGQCRFGHGVRGGEAFEELRCDDVYANVSALRGEDCCDEQFPG